MSVENGEGGPEHPVDVDGDIVEQETIDCLIELPTGDVLKLPGGVLCSDTAEYMRSALQEVKEACHFTAYHFVVMNDDGDSEEEINNFCELGQYLEPDQKSLKLRLVNDTYNVRNVREHVKRCRELLKFPSYMRSALASNQDDEVQEENNVTTPATNNTESVNVDDFLSPRAEDLSNFYDELLSRTGVPDPICVPNKDDSDPLPSSVIKSICESGWNPVPSDRQVQGDLMYLEVVTASEGVLQVTCIADGFYINRSSRNVFDGRPAANAAFSHTLLHCLFVALPALNRSWNVQETRLAAATKAARNPSIEQHPLDVLATLFTQGRGDDAMQRLQWNRVPSQVSGQIVAPKSYDAAEATEAAASRFGADLPGPPHDWNEDMQTARSVPGSDAAQLTLRSKIVYKTSLEFRVACEEGMKAIINGHVMAFNPMDPIESQVYLFNGIFFSGAVDNNDTFKLTSGAIASRKYAGHDLKNQQFVQSLGIEGLHTVMQVVMDYKGTRMIAQTVIPGVLATSGSSSRLLAGSVEPGKRMCMKNAAWTILEDLGKKTMLAERTVAAQPFVNAEIKSEEEKVRFGLPDMGIEEPQSPIAVDGEDEKVPIDSTTLPHVGPMEAKLIHGSDGRTYMLELARVTPRDANYVPKEAGGTGLISEEKLVGVDSSTASAYLIRRELVDRYLKYQAELELQETQQRYTKEEESRKNEFDAAIAALKPEDGENSEMSDESKKKREDLVAAFDAAQSKSMTGLIEEIKAVTTSSDTRKAAFRMNPNVFFSCVSADSDAAVVAKDEQIARDLATFLFEKVMPSVTSSIRLQDQSPLDSSAAAKLLHDSGINMRYLGHMAHLARDQEAEDIRLMMFDDKMMVHRMPAYWRDLLEVEMLARAVKIYLDQLLQDSQAKSCPAPTVASVLSGLLNMSKSDLVGTTIATQQGAPESSDTNLSKSAKKNKKKKQKKLHAHQSDENNGSIPSAVNLAADSREVQAGIDAILRSRFNYSLEEIRKDMTYETVTKDKTVTTLTMDYDKYEKQLSGAFGPIGERLSRVMILRRICQQAGIRITTRKYTWEGDNCGVYPEDICDLTVRTKTCEPHLPSLEAMELLRECDTYTRERKLNQAYSAANECKEMLTQIVGPTHRQTALANEALFEVIRMGGDVNLALVILQKNLLTWVQLYGLDSVEAISCHLRIADMHMSLGQLGSALAHLQSARYGVELMGGINHPLMLEVVQKISTYMTQLAVPDNDGIYRLLCYARDNCLSILHQCYYRTMIAGILKAHNQYDRAIAEMKMTHAQLQNILGENDPRVKEAKDTHLEFIREFTKLKVQYAQIQQADQSNKLEQELATKIALNEEQKNGSGGGKKNSKKKKNKK